MPATSIASNANDEASSAQEGGYFGGGFDAPNEYGYFESAITVAEQKRKDKLTELNLRDKGLGPTEGLVLAELVKGSTTLKKLDVSGFFNRLGDEAMQLLRDAVSGRDGFELKL